MTKTITKNEREAAVADRPEIANDPPELQDQEIIQLEELAALYVSTGGRDPRAMKIFEAAKAAGRIDSDGNWVDEE